MFDVDDIRDWRGLPVVDKEGGKIGKLEAVYFDTATEEPTFATVKVGFPGGGRLMTDKKTAKEAPSIDTDGELEAAGEPAIYGHYGLDYQVGANGERRLGRR
jgi:hypothetical protein